MGCGKDLAEGEKVLAIKEIAKVKTNKSIAKRTNLCVTTEIGESVRIFGKILQEETSLYVCMILRFKYKFSRGNMNYKNRNFNK